MSIDGVKLHEGWPVLGDRRVRPVRSPGRWERFLQWRWRWLLLAMIVIVAAAASVVLTLASDYQPLMYGDTSMRNLAYPGLPAGQGIRTVNTFGGIREDLYIPPQRGTFYLFADIMNGGSRAVIVENVFIPYGSALTPAGRARYARPPEGGNVAVGSPQPSPVLHDVTLRPGDEIFVAIPVRSWRCAERDSWASVPSFNVKYRFGIFHHVAALPWGMQNDMLIMHAPFGQPGQSGIFCVSR